MTREEAIRDIEYMQTQLEIHKQPRSKCLDMAIKALETVEEFEKAHIITGGRLNGRTYAYKCGLEDGKRKALEQEPCEDAVSRQTVSYIIKSHIHEIITESGTDKNAHTNAVLRSIVNLVETMPSVTPTRKKGKWIVEVWNNKEHHTCSNCQHLIDYEPCYHYCPYCGAEMESEKW